MGLRKNLEEHYTPVLFLSALGNGGLAVSFYVYLHFMIKHLTQTVQSGGESAVVRIPMATFGAIKPVLLGDNLIVSILTALALAGILFFAARHYFFLYWNLREFARFRKTESYQRLLKSNSEISLAAIPLTLAMSINVFFVLAGVFVPGLWNFVEYLFPFALLGFLAVGIYALQIFVTFMTRILTRGDFEGAENNSLSQMIAVFAFAMVGVGFAAPGAMSTNLVTSALGIIGATFFLSATVLIGLQSLFIGFRDMMDHGIDTENTPTLWILIPIMTLIGIAVVRIDHGLHMNLKVHTQPGELFVTMFILLSVQILFAAMGWQVMRQVNYFKRYLSGPERSPTSYALICPGVAFFVFGMFVLHMGVVRVGVLPRFEIAYFVLLVGLVAIQVLTIITMFRLDRKLLQEQRKPVPAVSLAA